MSVESLKNVIAGQATIFAFGPLTGGQGDAAIASAAFRAGNIGLSHGPKYTPGTTPPSSPAKGACHTTVACHLLV
jgi:hypothetical protein